MSPELIQHEEGFSLSSLTPPIVDLQRVISTSPSVARLLPHLMRNLADAIEKASYAHQAPPAVSVQQFPTLADAQSVVRHVVSGLSMALSHHLAGSLSGETFGESSISPVAMQETSVPPASTLRVAVAADAPERTNDEPSDLPRLRLKLLGAPEITLDGVRLTALERCGRAAIVVYILALHRGGLSAERLAAYIASDSADVDAFDTDANMRSSAVRTFVWRLRKLAKWRGIVVSPGEHGGLHTRYRLPDDATCDLWEFESNLDAAARLSVRADIEPDAADRAATLRQDAILLYGGYGGEFCKGIGAGTILRAAEYLRQRYLQALLLQAAYWKDKAVRLREAGTDSTGMGTGIEGRIGRGLSVQEEKAWLGALSNYRLAAQVEPCDELIYVGAMLCEAQLGRSRGVQETLARCTRVVQVELDRGLLPATLQAGRECLQLASGYSAPRSMPQKVSSAPAGAGGISAPVINRDTPSHGSAHGLAHGSARQER